MSDAELYAVAAFMQKQHGDDAPVQIAAKIGKMALAGDRAGVDTWKAVAARHEALAKPNGLQ